MLDINIRDVEHWAESYLQRLNPSERRKFLRQLLTLLRQRNQQRMKQQVEPDGTAWAARKNKDNNKALFKRMRLAKRFKTRFTADYGAVGFKGNTARIARIHHYGLRERFKNGAVADYEARQLLGFSKQDKKDILERILNHITPNKS